LEGLITARNAALPILTAEPGLTHYLEEIRRFPMLERQEEYMLAKRWREDGDRDAAHKLVTSHLRLVTKIARDYRGCGLPISEAISEGHVGLMQAVERFEPEKGFRFATYAVWWIKAAIQEYILRSRSHHEPRLRRVAQRVRRRQDDNCAAQPSDPPLRHRHANLFQSLACKSKMRGKSRCLAPAR
jgi:RNA polymerase sigma factor (sigma-70 family)